MSRSVSLILGSGGARGLAHIGVIHELERQGFKIDAVVGTSMGALIGGFYCAGRLDAYEEWVTRLDKWDVIRFLDISLTAKLGMMKGDLIMDSLKGLMGDHQIDELPIPFTAVACDILSRKEVWLTRGDLFDAIRASIAIPGLFTPKVINGRTLVDGGLLNPLPAAPANANHSDLTIAVSLSGREVAEPFGPNPPTITPTTIQRYRTSIDGFLTGIQDTLGLDRTPEPQQEAGLGLTDVLLAMFDTMQGAIARYRLAGYPPDILIEIPVNVCDAHEFFKAPALIEAGRHWTAEALRTQVVDHKLVGEEPSSPQ